MVVINCQLSNSILAGSGYQLTCQHVEQPLTHVGVMNPSQNKVTHKKMNVHGKPGRGKPIDQLLNTITCKSITIDILTFQSEYVGLWNRHFGQVAHILEVATCRTFQWVHFSCSKLPSKQALSLNYYSNHQFSALFVLQDGDNIAVEDWCHPTWQVQYAIASMAEMILPDFVYK